VDDDTPGLCIGDHAEEIRVEKRLSPIPENEEKQGITDIVNEIGEGLEREQRAGPGMRYGGGEAEGAFEVAEIGGFNLGYDWLAEGRGREQVLVQACSEKIESLCEGNALGCVGEHFEFKIKSASQKETWNSWRHLGEMKYLHGFSTETCRCKVGW
jgi:hypothetical protein